ncbi:hypothetical protein VTO73DRAFT_6059 [Trametes versicolor]
MVSSSNTISTTNASPPFNRPSADIILRSCDLVDFRVQSGILIEASPFFSDMFELPQPPSSAAEATPVVDMTEDAQTLDLLLRLVYPIVNPPLEEPMLMLLVLKGAAKYDMALPTSVVSKRLLAITPNKALQVWAAACQVRTGLEDVARQAAVALRASWKHTENEALSLMGNLGDMSGISAGDYLRLKQFLRAPQSDIDAERLALLSPPPEAMARPPPISPTPFSTDLPSPDVICRSLPQGGPGSERSFEAHRLVLSMHSPILKTRLNHTVGEIPSPSDPDSKETSSNDALATLELDEKSDIVSLLLKACYDGEEGLPADLDLATVAELFRASRKYEMTRIARLVCGAWDRVAALNPLEAYLVAINHGLDEYARAAAKNVLMGPIANAYTTVMEDAPALAYHRAMPSANTSVHGGSGDVVPSESQYIAQERDHSLGGHTPEYTGSSTHHAPSLPATVTAGSSEHTGSPDTLCQGDCAIALGWIRKTRVKTMIQFLTAHNPYYRVGDEFKGFSQANMDALFGPGTGDVDEDVLCSMEIGHIGGNDAVDGATGGYVPGQNDGPPAGEDGILMENVGYTDNDDSPINYREMTMVALEHCIKDGRYLKVQAASRFIPDFRNSSLLSWLFPHLDPWGIGGFFKEERFRQLTMDQQLKYLLMVHDSPFRKDPDFAFVYYNILQKKAVFDSVSFRVSAHERDSVVKQLLRVNVEKLTKMIEAFKVNPHYKCQGPEEAAIMKLLMRVNTVSRDLPGSNGYKLLNASFLARTASSQRRKDDPYRDQGLQMKPVTFRTPA